MYDLLTVDALRDTETLISKFYLFRALQKAATAGLKFADVYIGTDLVDAPDVLRKRNFRVEESSGNGYYRVSW